MGRMIVWYSKAGYGQPDLESPIEVKELRRLGSRRVQLDSAAGTTLIGLLGNGYGEKIFDLSDGKTTLRGCRIVADGGIGDYFTVDYMDVGPANLHDIAPVK